MENNFVERNEVSLLALGSGNSYSLQLLTNEADKLKVVFNMKTGDMYNIPEKLIVDLKTKDLRELDIKISGGITLAIQFKSGPKKQQILECPIRSGKINWGSLKDITGITFVARKIHNQGREGILELRAL